MNQCKRKNKLDFELKKRTSGDQRGASDGKREVQERIERERNERTFSTGQQTKTSEAADRNGKRDR